MTTSDLGNVKFGMGGANLGFGWAENALTCDSEGNCMLKDELKLSAERHQQIRKNLGKTAKAVGKGVGKVAKAGANFAGTRVLPKVTRAFTGGKVGLTARIRDDLMADNALTCDSEGNCMLTDELKLSAERHQQIRKNLGKTAKAVGKGVGKVAKGAANVAGKHVLPKVTRVLTSGKVGLTARIRDDLMMF